MPSPHDRRALPLTALAACALLAALALASAAAAGALPSRSLYRAQRLCGQPRPGYATCLGMRLVAKSLTPAALRASALRQAREASGGATPAVTVKAPLSGLTPQGLRSAYSLPAESGASSLQTIAVVDSHDDPTAEADLGVYDRQFGLAACTTANGCFRKLNQAGRPSPLPKRQGE